MRTLEPIAAPSRGRGGAPTKRDQIWQRQHAANISSAARNRVAELAQTLGPHAALVEVDRYVERLRALSSPQSQLDALCHIIAALAEFGDSPALDVKIARHLLGVGRAILAEQSIDPRRSRVASLCSDLERGAAAVARRNRDLWTARWHEALADLSAEGETERNTAAELALLAGDAPNLVSRVLARESEARDSAGFALMRVRLLRLSGRPAEALAVLDEQPDETTALAWERAAIFAQQTGDLTRLATLLRRRDHKTPDHQLDFWLWAHAARSRRWRSETVKLTTIARRLKTDRFGLACATAIDALTRTTRRPLERLRKLGAALRATSSSATIQRELLIWAAAHRCLVAAKQPRFAAVSAARYVSLSRVASAGSTGDVLGIGIEFDETTVPTQWSELEFGKRSRRLPQKARERYLECGKMTVNLLRARVRGAVSSDPSLEWQRSALDLVTDHLGHLKGPLLKLGQLVSHYGLGLSLEEREALGALYDDAIAIESAEIERAIADEIGPVEQMFADFELAPFAAGSIGQVHRARTHEGVDVAVKVQYPGIEKAIASDLRLLNLIAPGLKLLYPKWNVGEILAELETMLLAECDYLVEASNQREFAALFAGETDIHIPAVIDSHTSRRVLTSTFERGLRLDEFIATADTGERTRAAERVAKFIVRTGIVRSEGHTDPHPGNFLVRPDSICVLDFGSAKAWPENPWRPVLIACMRNDADALREAFDSMGMIVGPLDASEVLERLRRYTMRWTVSDDPFVVEPDDVAAEIKTWLLDRSMSNLILRPRDLFGFRMYWGAFSLLARFKAPLDIASVVERELAALDDSL